MPSTYFLSFDGAWWNVFVRDVEIMHLHHDLPDEPTAMKRAIQHARATGRHFEMSILRIESDGELTTLFETHETH